MNYKNTPPSSHCPPPPPLYLFRIRAFSTPIPSPPPRFTFSEFARSAPALRISGSIRSAGPNPPLRCPRSDRSSNNSIANRSPFHPLGNILQCKVAQRRIYSADPSTRPAIRRRPNCRPLPQRRRRALSEAKKLKIVITLKTSGKGIEDRVSGCLSRLSRGKGSNKLPLTYYLKRMRGEMLLDEMFNPPPPIPNKRQNGTFCAAINSALSQSVCSRTPSSFLIIGEINRCR